MVLKSSHCKLYEIANNKQIKRNLWQIISAFKIAFKLHYAVSKVLNVNQFVFSIIKPIKTYLTGFNLILQLPPFKFAIKKRTVAIIKKKTFLFKVFKRKILYPQKLRFYNSQIND